MNLINITNLNTPELEIYGKMRGNAFSKDNSFVADSPSVVNLLLQSNIEVISILATQEYYNEYLELTRLKPNAKLYMAEKSLLEGIVGHKMHHNVMMHGKRPANVNIEDIGNQIIILDELSNMENVGAISRSAAAIGIQSMLVPKKAPHPYGRRAIRVSMGYVSKLKIHILEDTIQTIRKLKSEGYYIYGAEICESSIGLSDIGEVPSKWALIMGNEKHGLSDEIMELCDQLLHIEMQEGIKSFNVSIAASIIMYQLKMRSI